MKSPKEVFAEFVAYELSTYLVVDPKLVASSLLNDSKVVMEAVHLKEQVMNLSSTTDATITGVIDLVIFKWSWSIHEWVKDCNLKLLGLRVKVRMGSQQQHKQEETIDDVVAPESAMDRYIDAQIQHVIDSLTLHIKTFQVTIEMPLNLDDSTDGDTISLVWNGSSLDIACTDSSATSKVTNTDENAVTKVTDNGETPTAADTASSPIDQHFSMSSLSASVIVVSQQNKPLTYPLMEPFSFSAQVTRLSGLRFETLTGIVLVGDTPNENDKGIALHAGPVQMQALTQLADMVNGSDANIQDADVSSSTGDKPEVTSESDAKSSDVGQAEKPVCSEKDEPKADSNNQETATSDCTDTKSTTRSSTKEVEDLKQTNDNAECTATDATAPSSFDIPISSISVFFMDKMKLALSGIHVKYKTDGTLFTIRADRFDVDSSNPLDKDEPGIHAGVAGISCHLLPDTALTIETIETAHVPGVLDLTKPLNFPSIKFEGDTAYVDVSSTIEATILNKPDSSQEKDAEAKAEGSDQSIAASQKKVKDAKGGIVPFPIRVSFQELKLTSESDNSKSRISDLVLAFHPRQAKDFVGTAVALHLGGFKNELLQCQKANLSVIVSENSPRVMRGFSLDAESIQVESGYTMEDWIEQFEPSRLRQILQVKEGPLEVPFAHIAALNIQIGFKGTGVSVEDTTVNVKAFHGKASTTTKDIVQYYARACARTVSGFISNAEICGHNVVETTAVYGGACAGLEDLGGPTAVALVAGIDAAKTLLARGKEGRHATAKDHYKLGDFTRGVLETPGLFAKKGAKVRGKQDDESESVTDVAFGAVSSVGNYAVDNKAKLGGAFFAGVGALGGAAIGGPVGAILGGLIGGAVATKAIKSFDKSAIGKKANKRIKEDLAGARLPELAAKLHVSKGGRDDHNDLSSTSEKKDKEKTFKLKKHDHRHGIVRHHREKRQHEK